MKELTSKQFLAQKQLLERSRTFVDECAKQDHNQFLTQRQLLQRSQIIVDESSQQNHDKRLVSLMSVNNWQVKLETMCDVYLFYIPEGPTKIWTKSIFSVQCLGFEIPFDCRAQVQVRWRSGEGQVRVRWGSGEGQVRVTGSERSESGKVQLRELKTQRPNLSSTYFWFSPPPTHHPPPGTFFLAFKGSRHVRWT